MDGLNIGEENSKTPQIKFLSADTIFYDKSPIFLALFWQSNIDKFMHTYFLRNSFYDFNIFFSVRFATFGEVADGLNCFKSIKSPK